MNYSHSGVIRTSISDHDIIYAVRKINNKVKKISEVKQTWNFKNLNTEDLSKSINSAPWWSIMNNNSDINNLFNLYCKIVKILLNKHAPMKNIKTNKTKSIWMTKEYSQATYRNIKLKRTAIKTNCPEDWSKYKKERNKNNRLKNMLKLKSLNNAINNSENQSKLAWSLFNKELGKNKTSQTFTKLKVDGYETTSQNEIANLMCNHYSSCANQIDSRTNDSNITSDIEDIECEFKDLLIDENDVLEAIKYLKVNKPVGSDGIPAKFYKMCAKDIAPILNYLFNECIKRAEIPIILKRTIIKNVFKGRGSKMNPDNYRPISIISSTAKILEKVIYVKLYRYVEENNLIDEHQHG